MVVRPTLAAQSSILGMQKWRRGTHTSKNFMERVGKGLSIQGLGRRAIGVGWENDTAGQCGPG